MDYLVTDDWLDDSIADLMKTVDKDGDFTDYDPVAAKGAIVALEEVCDRLLAEIK